jgi:hypothetical protein
MQKKTTIRRKWFTYVVAFAWLVTVAFWLYRMDVGISKFRGPFIIPALQLFWTLFGILTGGIFFREFHTMSISSLIGFTFGVILAFVGVLYLKPEEEEHEENDHMYTSSSESLVQLRRFSRSIGDPEPISLLANDSQVASRGSQGERPPALLGVHSSFDSQVSYDNSLFSDSTRSSLFSDSTRSRVGSTSSSLVRSSSSVEKWVENNENNENNENSSSNNNTLASRLPISPPISKKRVSARGLPRPCLTPVSESHKRGIITARKLKAESMKYDILRVDSPTTVGMGKSKSFTEFPTKTTNNPRSAKVGGTQSVDGDVVSGLDFIQRRAHTTSSETERDRVEFI